MSDSIDSSMIDPIALARDLIRCPSVTPEDAGALSVLENALKSLGFTCHRLRFEAEGTPPVENLYARFGTAAPNFCFAGHTDVVPPGDTQHWRHDPFSGVVENGVLYGRGAVDMKSSIAAFVAATAKYLREAAPPKGSISLLITGDEEGPAINGTVKVLDWMVTNGETIDHCIVGEPASGARSGDILKIGRRGSMNVNVTLSGIQGHAAYPQNALNPIPILSAFVARLSTEPLDKGTEEFEPSTIAFTSFDVGNPTTNVIPGQARAAFNIRFNDLHMPDSLMARIERVGEKIVSEMGGEIDFTNEVSGIAFVTKPGTYTNLLSGAVQHATGIAPEFSSGGGTSDARFIKDFCPVVELGLPGNTMHKVDECVPVAEVELLVDIYTSVLKDYFGSKHPFESQAV
jgi:succinyl-diaminopimelate desuccinylase